MLNGLLGEKIGMTHIYSEEGVIVPVTLIKAGPCNILQIKILEKDGYSAVQLGYGDKKMKRAKKPEIGHAAKASLAPSRFVREVKPDADADIKHGQAVTLDIFDDVKMVDIAGISKGKGFAGVMKRWGMKGGPETHGSTRHRSPGSIGAGTDPGRVIRGKRMPGRLGGERVTVKNLEVVKVDKNKNILFVKGAVPGHKGSYLIIKKVV
ncbi:MAG: 50S ribosomal protein L3 [Candidatus Kuenenia sp.]|nr:50S ribosomal protein L3 [Candidatus Kuenenia hertensis]